MKMNMYKLMRQTVVAGVGVFAFAVTACNPEPDESDLYTFTGETIESYIAQDSTLTAFNTILARVNYDKMMAAYGNYTCFAPSNEGVAVYCDSLYMDEEASIPYNGMRNPVEGGSYIDANSFAKLPVAEKIEWMSDSLCTLVARYHLSNISYDFATLMTTDYIQTMLSEDCFCDASTGQIILGGEGVRKAMIIDSDHKTVNGLVHKLDHVLSRSAISCQHLAGQEQGKVLYLCPGTDHDGTG